MASRNLNVLLTANSASLRSQLALASREVKSFGSDAEKAGNQAAAGMSTLGKVARGAGVALVVALAGAGTAAAQFESRMRNVNSISGLSEQGLANLSGKVLDLSRALPQSANTLAEGLYDIASSGFQGAEGLTVLNASAKAATAGLSDTATAAKAITAVLNAYGRGAEDAADVSDVLFQTVNLGVVTFGELQGVMADTVGIGAAAGVSVEELGAATATLTLSGISAAESGTALNRVLQTLIQPGDELRAVMESVGISTADLADPAIGLHGIMEQLRIATGGNVEALLKLFPEVRAAKGAFGLMANEGQTLKRVWEGISKATDGAGATQKAFDEQMKATSAQLAIFGNQLRAAAIEGGMRLLPMVTALLKSLQDLGGQAVPVVQAAMSALAPTFRNLREIGVGVVDVIHALVDALGPVAAAMGTVVGAGLISFLNALSTGVAAVTNLLADHNQVVIAAAVAYLGLKTIQGLSLLMTALASVTETLALKMLYGADAAKAATASFATLRGAITGLGGVLAVLGFTAAIQGMSKAKSSAEDFAASLTQNLDTSELDGATEAVRRLQHEQLKAGENTKAHGGWLNAFRGVAELVTPMANSVQEARERTEELNEQVERLGDIKINIQHNLDEVRKGTDLSRESAAELADEFDIDMSKPFKDSQGARDEFTKAYKELVESAYGGGAAVKQASGVSIDALIEMKKAADESAEAVSKAFRKDTSLFAGYEGSSQALADLADAEQNLGDVRRDVSERSAESQAAYAQRVADANEKIHEAEEDLAQRRIDLTEAVADAQRKLEEGRVKSAEAISEAEERLREVHADAIKDAEELAQRERDRQALAAAASPEARKAIQDQIDARKAAEDAAQQREDAAKAIAEAEKGLADARKQAEETEREARENLVKAQLDQVRGIEEAEARIADARRDGLEVQREGSKLSREQADGQRQIADATEAVAEAQAKVMGSDLGSFFSTQQHEAEQFLASLEQLARNGLRPALIQELLEAGPTAARPVLERLLSDQGTTLIGQANTTYDKLRTMNDSAVEMARATHRAINATNADVAADYGLAMQIIETKARLGGSATVEQLAAEMGIGVEKVRQVTRDYVIVTDQNLTKPLPATAGHAGTRASDDLNWNFRGRLKDMFDAGMGYVENVRTPLNTLLTGIGSPQVPSVSELVARFNPFSAAVGGYLPHDAKLQPPGTLVQWAEPETQGEYFIPRANDGRRPRAVGILAQAADDFGYQMVRKFAVGGDTVGLNADFLARLERWSETIPGGLHIQSGYRSSAEQAVLYARYKAGKGPLAAPPGSSKHEQGLAADHTPNSWALAAAAEAFAISHPVAGEPWHAEPSGGVAGGATSGPKLAIARPNIPPPPDFSAFGHMLGYQTWESSHYLYRQAMAFVDAKMAEMAAEASQYGRRGGPPPGGAGVGGDLNEWITQALAITGKPESWRAGLYARAMQESSGDPTVQNNWDSNARAGIPSKGLMQTIDPTFQKYKVPGYDDIWNPVHNMAAAINYIESRYGSPYNLPKGGYAYGGLHVATADTGGWVMPGRNLIDNWSGRPERIEPPGGGGATATTVTISVGDIHVNGAQNPREVAREVRKELTNIAKDLPGGAKAIFGRSR